ncbi:CRACD-like protein isoform X2 [Pimephales promelas]|uniref:CRACD-like protein isoform X2 n=1 Tax=Pimephales promelas TaxID=90988 RepID=UPI00195595C0|nr:CRACD-like protein isoform X2 [Pimephales promelas]KAG1926417.1 hypothetical protein F2P79_024884 [Pimephales promelas]
MPRLYSCFGDRNNCDIMASGSPDVTDATEPSDAGEECSGKKKSKFQTFKNFFVKKKRKESPAPAGESGLKASQSSDDVNTSEPTISHANSDNDRGSKINLGNKAMSHDSVFVSDSPLSETNEGLGASQDSIHGKVKSLQLQLKHAICLGSPPSLLCGRKGEDAGAFSDDDGLPCSPTEYSSLHTVLTTPLHTSVDLTQSSLSMEASDSEDDQMSYEASSRPATPQGSVPVDFSRPASSVSCLDSSAARHRIAVKANARAKRKPASREMLDRRRDLRERVLIRDAEDKLRMIASSGKEEREVGLDLVNDSDHESCASGLEEEEVTDSSQCHKISPTSSISAESVSEGEEHVPAEDHVPKSELPQSSWESPVTLDLQADDFLLDTGCEVVPEEQGSLLEEVLSSLKSPLVSGLALEHENMVLQSEVKDINSGRSVVSQLEEDLLDPSNPIVPPEEPAPLPDSLPESPVDSEEILEETTEEEELLEDSESADESSRVPEADADKQVDTAKEDQEFFQSPKAFAVNVQERDEDEVHEDVVEEEAELERETRDSGDDVEKDDEVEPEKTESSANDQPQGAGGQRRDETSVDHRESVEVNFENVSESDQTVRDDIWSSTETTEDSEVLLSAMSPALESPILHFQFSNALMCPLEQEEESSEPDVSTEPQEESSEKPVAVSEHQDQPVLESPTGEQRSSADVRPRFTIAPAWQRSQFSGGTQEQTVSLPETPEANASTPQTYELFTPAKEERPVPDGSRSSPSLPMQRETTHVHEETSPENPFGVRLRKTPILHRYGLDGESPRTHTEASGAQETPDQDQNARKPVLPNKADPIVDAVMSARKIPDAVGRISASSAESPSWISVARQKQKNFMETSAEKLPSQGEDKRPDSPSSLSDPVTKEQPAQPCSPLQVCCSLELSNTSMLEKESKRSADPSAAPLAQDEPPWLALAKKKAKAWSEMPQIVQ